MEIGEVRALCIWDAVNVDSRVYIPKQWVIPFDTKKLIEQVYGDFASQHSNSNYLIKRAVSAPTNEDVDSINNIATSMFAGHEYTYLSSDRFIDSTNRNVYPHEFLNS